MNVKIQSIYHFRLLKPPKLRYPLILLIIFMALNLYIINNIKINVKQDILIKDHEFNLDVNVNRIYYDNQALVINNKEVKKDYVTYRIAANLDGEVTITYQTRLIKNI